MGSNPTSGILKENRRDQLVRLFLFSFFLYQYTNYGVYLIKLTHSPNTKNDVMPHLYQQVELILTYTIEGGSHKFGVASVYTAFNFIQQNSPPSVTGKINTYSIASNPGRIKLKPPADATDFQRKCIEPKLDKICAHLMTRGDKIPGLNTYALFVFSQIETSKLCFFLTNFLQRDN